MVFIHLALVLDELGLYVKYWSLADLTPAPSIAMSELPV